MKKKLKLSIITVTFNAGELLKSTLESILCQEADGIELLIIDGKSTDDTLSIARLFENHFDNLTIVSEPDNGIYDAMNKGINIAKGEYIFFLNAGDIFFDNSVLRKMLPQLNGSDVFYGDSYTYNDCHEVIPFRVGEFSKYRLTISNICHQTIFYPTSLLKKNKYECKYKIVADRALNMKLWKKCHFSYIKIPVVLYLGGGISNNTKDDIFARDFKKLVIKSLGLDALLYLCFYKTKQFFVGN